MNRNLTRAALPALLAILLLSLAAPAAAGDPARHPMPLHAAVLARDAGSLRALVLGGADVHARDEHGRTSLHLAALGGQDEMVRMLLDAGADPHGRDRRGDTPLHLAARRLRTSTVDLLLRAGADVNARNEPGRTPLHLLADQGPDAGELDVRMVEIAGRLIAGKADAGRRDGDGNRAVDYAAWRGHEELTKHLREQGGPPPAAPPIPAEGAAPFEYHTFEDIENELLAAELDLPGICRRVNLGLSVQGRPLWALNISDNVGFEEDEPEFKYISSMHGDEVVGIELCMLLIDEIVALYGTDDQITDLVDEVDIWIVPCMNPDGLVAGTRNNAQGVNLNRDFPDPYTSPNNSTVGRAPETAAIMNWSFANSFTLAANYHCGELVVNYPFDANESGSFVYTATPDDDLFIWISEEYSRYNGPLWNSSYYYHGITNGADWYVIYGGMQDWSYVYMGCNEVTIEVSESDKPPASQLATFWAQNRDSMLAYLETVLIGVRGVVTDAASGLPVSATITVEGRDHEVYTDPDVGDYHRMLLPGTYDLRFEAEGYDPLVVPGVIVTEGDATRLDVALGAPARVVFPNGGEVLSAGVAALVEWAGDGAARFQVQETPNYGALAITSDGFETGEIGPDYVTGGDAAWFATTQDAWSGAWSARAGDIGDYDTSWLERTVSGGALSFRYRVSSEANYDFFDFSVDGDLRIHASGTSGGWTLYTETLPPGEHVLRWEFNKDVNQSGGSDTAWIDDLEITEDMTTWTDVVALSDPGATSIEWTPAIETEAGKVRVRAYYGDGVYGAWDESDGTFEVVAGDCSGDIDGDGIIGFTDLVAVLSAWGPCPGCPEDIDGDGTAGFSDLLIVLQAWGSCP